MESFIRNLTTSLHEGFIDKNQSNSGSFKPELLINNEKKNSHVLNTLQEELASSEDFLFSVAFITESGLATLKSLFLDLKEKGITGRILTSTYLYFNQPKVFKELMKLTNIEVRLTNLKGFHSKGYIFKHHLFTYLIIQLSPLKTESLFVHSSIK